MDTGAKVRVADPIWGGTHLGKVEDIVADMFDGSPLYLVRVRIDNKPVVRTYKPESLKPIKQRKRRTTK